MAWLANTIDELAARPAFGYTAGGPGATEPTALAALALAAHGRLLGARRAAAWLARRQNDDGSVGVMDGQREPCWPTSYAILAWRAVDAQLGADASFSAATGAAVEWLLSVQGERIEPNPQFGHDVTLLGWPWVLGTHSWMEPTALAVLALRSAGREDHPRCKEAIQLLVDRQLSGGGCNYGNTTVLGQELLPHVQPTGLALLALAGMDARDEQRVVRSLKWLRGALDDEQGTPSLCFGLLALAAHGQPHRNAAELLAAAHRRATRQAPSAYPLALLAHAGLGAKFP